MSENVTQNNTEQQDGQKTTVAFIVGLLIGGLVVWMFTGSPAEDTADINDVDTEETADLDEADADVANDENGTTGDTEPTAEDGTSQTPAPTVEMEVGDGSVTVSDQPASNRIALDSVTFPMSDGWIGVREYVGGNLGALLGVVRFSESEGLVPQEIILQRSTTASNEYAIVFYTAGDGGSFNLGVNSQVDGIFATFVAQ